MAVGGDVQDLAAAEGEEELFYQAVAEGDLKKVQRLLSRRSGERTLPPLSLHIAANGPSRDVLELLLQSDLLDVDSMDEESMLSPLHVAAIYGRAELVEALLGYGACPFVVDNEGCTPVDRAHINGHSLCASALIVAMSEGEVSLDSAPGDLTMSQAYVTMIQADDSMGGIVDDDRVTSDKTDTLLDDDSSSKDLSVHIPDTLLQLSNDALRRKLVSMGDNPGPINSGTRPLYLRYLSKLEAGQITRKEDKQGYQYELALCLSGVVPIPALHQLEKELETSLGTLPSLSLRGRGGCSSFNYLLLDPCALDDMSTDNGESGCFQKFVEGVFYVGKGKNARPLQHLIEARKSLQLKDKRTQPVSDKCARIHSIWSGGRGVVSLHCFHCISSEEAHTREACMLDAIGLSHLTNKVKGVSYGAAKRWQPALRRKFGVFLLYRAMKVLLADGLREIHARDL